MFKQVIKTFPQKFQGFSYKNRIIMPVTIPYQGYEKTGIILVSHSKYMNYTGIIIPYVIYMTDDPHVCRSLNRFFLEKKR